MGNRLKDLFKDGNELFLKHTENGCEIFDDFGDMSNAIGIDAETVHEQGVELGKKVAEEIIRRALAGEIPEEIGKQAYLNPGLAILFFSNGFSNGYLACREDRNQAEGN